MTPRVLGPPLLLLALALAGCGGGDDASSTTSSAPIETATTAQAPEPVTTIAVRSSDDRPGNRDSLPESGARTLFTVRADRDGRPLARERVELLADVFPFEGEERVVARGRTSRKGRVELRASFDRRARVRAQIGDAQSEPVAVRRSVRTDRGQVTELPDGRLRLTGVMHFPKALAPRFRFAAYVGDASRPRLPRIHPRIDVDRPRRGKATIAFTFGLPEGVTNWRLQVCVLPNADSGLSQPRSRCRGRTTSNQEYEETQRRKRQERRADRGAG